MFDFPKRSALVEQVFAMRHVFSMVLGCLLVASFFVNGVVRAADADFTDFSARNLTVTSSAKPGNDTGAEASSDSSAHTLYLTSGLKQLIGQIPVSTASSFEAALTAQQLPDLFLTIEQEAVADAVNNAFKIDTFDKYLIKQLDEGMMAQSREYMLMWYASSLGKRVKQAEIENSLLTEHTRFDNYQVFLKHYPADATRKELIRKLDITMKSTESAMEMMSSIQVAFNLSLTRFLPEEQRLTRQEILDMVAQNQESLLTHYEKKTKDVLLFTYQSLNNADLALLNDTMATDAGQEFVGAINTGIKKGMFAASLDLGDGLGVLLDALPQNSGI